MANRTEKVEFLNATGEKLAARLELPASPPKSYAIFAHCFTCSKDIAAATRISRGLTNSGVAVLRFDFTGLGNSEGDFANTNFSTNVQDLISAADHLRSHYQAPELLVGHSLGGAAVLAAASEISECRAVATVGAPSDTAHVSHLFEEHIDEIEAEGIAKVQLAGRPFTIKKQFIDDIKEAVLETKVKSLGKALAVFHAPQDETVSIEHAKSIYKLAEHPKSFISLEGADHLLTRKQDSQYVANVISAWSEKYLSPSSSESQEIQNNLKDGEVLVVARRGEKFTQDIFTSRHSMVADEPQSLKGTDLGANPYDFLLTSLGACTSMTIRMYADHKKIPLEHVAVKLRHEKIYAQDCESCEATEGRVDQIKIQLGFEGEITDEQCEKLTQIAHKCPVYRTLKGEVNILHEVAR